MSPVLMMLSREVRHVPMDYEPPRTDRGHIQSVFDDFYEPAMRAWQEEKRRWDAGERPDYCSPENRDLSFEEWSSEAPDPDYYYPGEAWPEGVEMGIRMYESVSEGTPISATYPDTPAGRQAMARELATTPRGAITDGMSADEWMRIIEGQSLAKDVHTGAIVGPDTP